MRGRALAICTMVIATALVTGVHPSGATARRASTASNPWSAPVLTATGRGDTLIRDVFGTNQAGDRFWKSYESTSLGITRADGSTSHVNVQVTGHPVIGPDDRLWIPAGGSIRTVNGGAPS